MSEQVSGLSYLRWGTRRVRGRHEGEELMTSLWGLWVLELFDGQTIPWAEAQRSGQGWRCIDGTQARKSKLWQWLTTSKEKGIPGNLFRKWVGEGESKRNFQVGGHSCGSSISRAKGISRMRTRTTVSATGRMFVKIIADKCSLDLVLCVVNDNFWQFQWSSRRDTRCRQRVDVQQIHRDTQRCHCDF